MTGSITPGVEEGGGGEGIEVLGCKEVKWGCEVANLDCGCQSGWEGSSKKYKVVKKRENVEHLNRNVE